MTPTLAQQALQILFAVALYAFLAALLVFLWRDERRAAVGAMGPPPAHLLRLDGEKPAGFKLSASSLVGRAADNAIRLDDPLVSAYHARLSFVGGQWIVEDLGSRNGTQINDLPVEGPVVLATGDILRIGGIELRFSSTEPPSEPGGDAHLGPAAQPD